MLRYVTIKAIRRDLWVYLRCDPIEDQAGEWIEGGLYVKAPDGRILIDTQTYDAWAESGSAACGLTMQRRPR